MEGAAVTDGIKYLGADRFIVTKDRLMELLETEVEFKVCDYLFAIEYPASLGTQSALNDLYPGLGITAYSVADSIVDELMTHITLG